MNIQDSDIYYKSFIGDVKILFELDKKNDKHHWSLGSFSGKHKIKVAYYNNVIVGFIVYNDVVEIEILRLLVDKDFRNLGIASDLIYSIGHKNIILEVRSDNNTAINLYKKLGFIQIGERKNYYKDGKDAFIMQQIKNI